MYAIFNIQIKEGEYQFSYNVWAGNEKIEFKELRKQIIDYIKNFYYDSEEIKDDKIDKLYLTRSTGTLIYSLTSIDFVTSKQQVIDKILDITEAT